MGRAGLAKRSQFYQQFQRIPLGSVSPGEKQQDALELSLHGLALQEQHRRRGSCTLVGLAAYGFLA